MTEVAYLELFHCFVPNRDGEDPDDHEHDFKIPCEWGFLCNSVGCTFRTDDGPCPDHAPRVAPSGWRLVECHSAQQLHYLLSHDREDYGHGCPSCWADRLTAELKPFKHMARLREHRWCWFTNRGKQAMIWCRLMRRSGWSNEWGYCSHTSARWRWSR